MTRHCIVRGFCWFVCACALVSILALSAAEKDGFVSIFNGSNLDGWKTSPQIEKHWVAKNGNLKNSTALPREDSATLWTEKSYNRYTLIFDWRSVAKEHAQESIAVLVYGGPPHRILLKGNSEGGWNHAEIKVQDGIVFASVYQSPSLTRMYETGASHGAIGLEDPLFPVQFTKIYIKELPAETLKLEAALLSDGFVPLFNGRNLDGWEIASLGAGWKVNDSILENHSGHSAIISAKAFGHYELIFDWRIPKDDPHQNAPYLYIDRGPYSPGPGGKHRNGVFLPEATLPPALVGSWNHSRVTVEGDQCVIEINDRVVRTLNNLSGGTDAGKFGIGRGGARLDLANIYIKELK